MVENRGERFARKVRPMRERFAQSVAILREGSLIGLGFFNTLTFQTTQQSDLSACKVLNSDHGLQRISQILENKGTFDVL
jgi:hypothetical protein